MDDRTVGGKHPSPIDDLPRQGGRGPAGQQASEESGPDRQPGPPAEVETDSNEAGLSETDQGEAGLSENDQGETDQSETEETPAPGFGLDVIPNEPIGRSRGPLIAVVAILVAALVGAGIWWVNRPGAAQQPATSVAEPSGPARSDTLFLSISAPDNTLVSGMLFGTGKEGTSTLLVPGDLTLDVPTLGDVPLRQALPVAPDVPGAAVSDLLGVRVDASWVMPMDGLAGLIDTLGGVEVAVDTRVEANGVVLEPGASQKLNGLQALTYGGWTANGESPTSQLVRMGQVVTVTLAAMPTKAEDVQALLAAVPGTTTLQAGDLAAKLARIAADARSDRYVATVLPATPQATPVNPRAVSVDGTAARNLLTTTFGGDLLYVPGSAGEVSVQNATGSATIELAARRRLLDAGYRYHWTGLAEPVQLTTVVMVRSADSKDRQAGVAVAQALGLTEKNVAVGSNVPIGQQALVLLGVDFVDVAAADAGVEAVPADPAAPSATP